MLGHLKDLNNVIFDGADSLNPFVSKMDAENIEIATVLLDKGYSVKRIQKFIDTSRTQADEWLELEDKVRERMERATAPTQPTE